MAGSNGLKGAFVRVRVVGDPGGDPPAWVRAAWVGVEFDAQPTIGKTRQFSARGRRWYSRGARNAWLVVAAEAVAALRIAGQSDAADWWAQHGFADGVQTLVFNGDACEPVDNHAPSHDRGVGAS